MKDTESIRGFRLKEARTEPTVGSEIWKILLERAGEYTGAAIVINKLRPQPAGPGHPKPTPFPPRSPVSKLAAGIPSAGKTRRSGSPEIFLIVLRDQGLRCMNHSDTAMAT